MNPFTRKIKRITTPLNAIYNEMDSLTWTVNRPFRNNAKLLKDFSTPLNFWSRPPMMHDHQSLYYSSVPNKRLSLIDFYRFLIQKGLKFDLKSDISCQVVILYLDSLVRVMHWSNCSDPIPPRAAPRSETKCVWYKRAGHWEIKWKRAGKWTD